MAANIQGFISFPGWKSAQVLFLPRLIWIRLVFGCRSSSRGAAQDPSPLQGCGWEQPSGSTSEG